MLVSEDEELKTGFHEIMHDGNDTDRFSIFEIEEIIKSNIFFSSYSKEQISEIALITKEWRAEKGGFLCMQGDPGSSIYIITKGNVGVVKHENREQKHVYTAGPGEILGEIAVLGNIPRSASLKALDSVSYLEIDGGHFLQMLHDNPDMSLKIIKLLVYRFAA